MTLCVCDYIYAYNLCTNNLFVCVFLQVLHAPVPLHSCCMFVCICFSLYLSRLEITVLVGLALNTNN